MCDPITIASIAAAGGGALISGNEANNNAKRMQDARNAATMAEVQRDQAFGKQAQGSFDQSLNLFGPASTNNLTQAQTDVGSLIKGNMPTQASVGSIGTGNAPAAVAQGETAKLGDVFSRYGTYATNMGNLKGYDTELQNRQLGINQGNRDIGVVNNEASNSANVAKLEQNAAATNAAKPPSGIGELLSFAGNVGANLSGKGKIGLPSFTGSTTLPSPGFNATGTGGLY